MDASSLVSQFPRNWPWSYFLAEDWHRFDPQKLPRISVIVPSLNQAAYLEESILSVLNQRYPKMELIVVDGDSSDDSLQIIQKYSDPEEYGKRNILT